MFLETVCLWLLVLALPALNPGLFQAKARAVSLRAGVISVCVPINLLGILLV